MHVHPASPPPVHPPAGHVHPPPPQPERLVMRKDEAVGNKKKMQICLPKHNYKLSGGEGVGGVGQPKMCIPLAKS
jgi:hypothetical protein